MWVWFDAYVDDIFKRREDESHVGLSLRLPHMEDAL